MRLFALAFVLFAACKSQEQAPAGPQLTVGPVTEEEAKAFAEKLIPLVRPCDPAKLEPLIDREALAARFMTRTEMPDKKPIAMELARRPVAGRILCGSMAGIDEYRLLHVHMVDGKPRPVLRRIISDKRSGAVVPGYDELELGKTKADGVVRIVDAYSYMQGQWLTEILSGNRDALAQSVDYLGYIPEMADTIKKAQDLQRQGLNKEALEIIDSLPKAAHNYRGVQMMRVRAAFGVSPQAYKQALDELAEIFHNDVSVAMIEANGAFNRGDFDAAIKWIDMLDNAIGGDAFQGANRALAYLRRGKPGDVDTARDAIDKAIAMEPTLKRVYEVKLDVTLAQKKWADSVAVMTILEDKFGVVFDDAKLAAQPAVAPLLASPEYKEWRAGRKR